MSPAARERVLEGLRRQNSEAISALARRNLKVATLKKILPAVAALLLAALGLAPSWQAGPEANRVSYHVQATSTDAAASRMQGAQYHGTDQQGQPFTVTAASADQKDSNDVALVNPVGDITLKSGAWLELKSDTGMFHQQSQKLRLNGHVTLYRNDGSTMSGTEAEIDLRAGSAVSQSPVQAQGPFGTLTAAKGFVLTNRGADILFKGPATLNLTQVQ
jgi:lipopolysaccharide export system protein LptC